MATFRQWLEGQETREDNVGWFARYWSKITPGRVSTPTGIGRELDKRIENARACEDENPEQLKMEQTARAFLDECVKEYHKAEAYQNAVNTGAIEPLPQQADTKEQQPHPSLQDEIREIREVLMMLEAKITRTGAMVAAILGEKAVREVLATLSVPEEETTVVTGHASGFLPADWDDMYRLAEVQESA